MQAGRLLVRFLFVLGDDAGDHVGGEAAVDLLADHGHGGQTASTHATEGVEAELAVGGALAHGDTQLALVPKAANTAERESLK